MLLYQLYDLQRAALRPVGLWADAMQSLADSPHLPPAWAALNRVWSAGATVVGRLTRDFSKPAFGLVETEIDGVVVPVREEVVARLPFCELRHFARETGAAERADPRLLLVAPLSGHHATLLRDTVRDLLPAHDVFVTDWVDARQVPLEQGAFDLDAYIAYVRHWLSVLGPDTHVVAVCQAAVPVLAAVALLAEEEAPHQPRSMTLMGGPIDVTAAPTAPSRLAQAHSRAWFERTVISQVPAYYPGAYRHVFPGFVQLSGFMSMHLDRHIGAHWELFLHLVQGDGESAEAHRRFYDEHLSVMDLPAEFYLQTIEAVFQRHDLPRGTFSWRGRRVVPEAIGRTALLTIEGALDDISAPGQTRAAHDLCRNIPASAKAHYLQDNVGHFGIFHGRRWRGAVLPRLHAFIRGTAAA